MNSEHARALASVKKSGEFPLNVSEERRRWYRYWSFTTSHFQKHVRLTERGEGFLKQCLGEDPGMRMTVNVGPLGLRIEEERPKR